MLFLNIEQVKIEVDESNGYIQISQDTCHSQNEITLSPEQADLVIQLLQRARDYSMSLNSNE